MSIFNGFTYNTYCYGSIIMKIKKIALQRFFIAHTCCICPNGFIYNFCFFEYLSPNFKIFWRFWVPFTACIICFLVNLVSYRYCFVSVLVLIWLENFTFQFCFAKISYNLLIGLQHMFWGRCESWCLHI